MAMRPDPVTPNGGVPLNGGVPANPSDATRVDETAVGQPTTQSEGNSEIAALKNATGRLDARFTVCNPQAADAEDRGDIAEVRSEAADGTSSAITPDVVDAQIERVFWPYEESLPKALELISLLKPESAQPIKLEKLANRLAEGFERVRDDQTPVLRVVYEKLVTFAHDTLRESAQVNRDDYAKAFEAIARMTRYLPTGTLVTEGVHLYALYEGRRLPPVNVELGARAALAVLDEKSSDEVKRDTFLLVLAKAETYGPGEREPLVIAIAENLDKCPMSGQTIPVPSRLVDLSQQESSSCKAKVEDAVKKYSEAHEAARRRLLGLS